MVEEKSLFKHTTAWLPLVMSLAALLLIVGYVAFVGVSAQPAKDEGMVARIFQLFLIGQLPIIGYFAGKYFPKNRQGSFWIIVIQIFSGLVPFATIFFLEM